MTDKQALVDLINNIIDEAIIHGGDSGGAYCRNSKDLLEILKKALVFFELSEYEIDQDKEYEDEEVGGFMKIVHK